MIQKKFLNLYYKKNKKKHGNTNSFIQDLVINSVGQFKYNPEEEVTFVTYFRHYEEMIQKDCEKWLDKKDTFVTG